MKVKELQKVMGDKIGRVDQNGVSTEPHEDSTILYLAQFGFDIEVIKPANTKKTKNADVFMLGAIWEMKAPTTFNKATIKEDFRRAAGQSDRVIFDLRRLKRHAGDVEKQIVGLFSGRGKVRQLIIIEKEGKVLYFTK